MAARRSLAQPRPDPAAVLTRALLRASGALGLSGQVMSRVVGVSAASWSRLVSGERQGGGHHRGSKGIGPAAARPQPT